MCLEERICEGIKNSQRFILKQSCFQAISLKIFKYFPEICFLSLTCTAFLSLKGREAYLSCFVTNVKKSVIFYNLQINQITQKEIDRITGNMIQALSTCLDYWRSWVWIYSSMAECLPSKSESLGSNSSLYIKKKSCDLFVFYYFFSKQI